MAFADAQDNAVILAGLNPAIIKVEEAVKAGDALGFSSGWYRALATTGSVVQLRCVAAIDGRAGQEITAYFGPVIIGGNRFSGGTAGNALYVAESTDEGKYTLTAPSTTGDANTVVGYMVSTTIGIVTPNFNADSVA